MKNPEDIEHFRLHFKRLRQKMTITDFEFLTLCKETCVLARKYWDHREVFADRLNGVWLQHDRYLTSVAQTIGEHFIDLELPDVHVYLEEGQTVKDRWEEAEEAVDRELSRLSISD